ncbi:MAG TPA: hypothetical protein PK263_00590, partial [bacterium]|nr:hypothetical protein [bacterium]
KEVSYPLLPLEVAVIKSTAGEAEDRHEVVRKIDLQAKPSSAPVTKTEDPPSVIPEKVDKVVPEVAPEVDSVIVVEEQPTAEVAVLEMTSDLWEKIVGKTKEENAALAALLRDAKPADLSGDTLKLAVRFQFHKERISDLKNCKILERVASDVLNGKVRIVCELDDGKKKAVKPVGTAVNLEEAVGEIFDIE